MVDESGDASVRIDLEVVRSLVFTFLDGQINGLIGQSELLENDGDFPSDQNQRAPLQ